MNIRFNSLIVLASLLPCTGAVHAAVSISPGGSVTLSGTTSFKVTSSRGTEYAGTCTMTIQANFDPATASFTTTSVSVSDPCGTVGGWNVSTPNMTPPWSGVTAAVSSTAWRSTISGANLVFFQDGPPWWAALCTTAAPAFTANWVTGSVLGHPSTATAITTNGFKMFANGTGGQKCHLSFVLNLSPYQTLTNVP